MRSVSVVLNQLHFSFFTHLPFERVDTSTLDVYGLLERSRILVLIDTTATPSNNVNAASNNVIWRLAGLNCLLYCVKFDA